MVGNKNCHSRCDFETIIVDESHLVAEMESRNFEMFVFSQKSLDMFGRLEFGGGGGQIDFVCLKISA